MVEIYSIILGNIADNIVSSVRLTNNMVFSTMIALKTLMQQARNNAKELSGIWVTAVKR
jgi:hypothetical protein